MSKKLGSIRLRDKNGNVKYIATDKGQLLQMGKDGSVKNIIGHEDTGKTEEVKIIKSDLKG